MTLLSEFPPHFAVVDAYDHVPDGILGMMGALELVPAKPSRHYFPDRGTVGARTRDIALANGLILRATNDAMLLSPPLVISRAQVDELFDKAWTSLDQAAAEFGVAALLPH